MDPLHLPVKDVLEFLQELYERGLRYSYLNTARSALPSIIVLDGNVTVGNHPLVQRFLKGVFQTRPAFARYTTTWDTSIVLTDLKTLHPPKEISLQNLTHQLAMLCALATGQLCQTLHLMNLWQVRRNPDTSYIFCIDQIVKQSAPGREQRVLLIPTFAADRKVCVATVLDEYIDRTSSLQGEEQQT